jgi:hypothetical protein
MSQRHLIGILDIVEDPDNSLYLRPHQVTAYLRSLAARWEAHAAHGADWIAPSGDRVHLDPTTLRALAADLTGHADTIEVHLIARTRGPAR